MLESTASQPALIALADGGPLLQLGRIAGRSYHSTADPAAFTAMLRATRPRYTRRQLLHRVWRRGMRAIRAPWISTSAGCASRSSSDQPPGVTS
jgi:hypothetical protein